MKIKSNYHIISQNKKIYILNTETMSSEYIEIEVENLKTIEQLRVLNAPKEKGEYSDIIDYFQEIDILVKDKSILSKSNVLYIKSFPDYDYIINCGFPILNVNFQKKKLYYTFYLDEWLNVEIVSKCQCFNKRMFATLPYLKEEKIDILHEAKLDINELDDNIVYERIYCLPNCRGG